jgi:pimeloyl-ACP methyl ester carboxylesterase
VLNYQTYTNPAAREWVTFVHGAGGSSAIWFRQVKTFREHFNVLLVDLRGHGRSQHPRYDNLQRYSFVQVGDDVLEVLDHLGIAATHFVGISLGTIIIREITERHPERTLSMIMGGAVMKLNIRGQLLMRLGLLLKSLVPYLILYRFFAFIIMPRPRHRESRSLFIREARKLYQREFKRWFTLVSEVNPLLRLFRIKDSGVPTLYIMGEEDHMFLPSISRLVREHPNAILHVIPQCGHVVNVERPHVFNQRAIQFLGQL